MHAGRSVQSHTHLPLLSLLRVSQALRHRHGYLEVLFRMLSFDFRSEMVPVTDTLLIRPGRIAAFMPKKG